MLSGACCCNDLDRGHTRFRNFDSITPVDVIRVKSYVNSFLDRAGVPVRVSINKLYLVQSSINYY